MLRPFSDAKRASRVGHLGTEKIRGSTDEWVPLVQPPSLIPADRRNHVLPNRRSYAAARYWRANQLARRVAATTDPELAVEAVRGGAGRRHRLGLVGYRRTVKKLIRGPIPYSGARIPCSAKIIPCSVKKIPCSIC
jgi:hypothetical protein